MAGKHRSPNYPAVSLPDAVSMAKKLWDAEKRTSVNGDIAAKALGFNGLNGKVRVMIGALRQYGLLTKGKPGLVQLSDLAVSVLHEARSSASNHL